MHVFFLFITMIGDPGMYNPSNRGILGSTIPKIESGLDPGRSNWLPHMHLPRKNFSLVCLFCVRSPSFIVFTLISKPRSPKPESSNEYRNQ